MRTFLFDIVRSKACFGEAPNPAREARALPGNSQRALQYLKSEQLRIAITGSQELVPPFALAF